MLLFGHIGITLVSVAFGFGLKDKLRQGTTGDGMEETSLIEDRYSSNKRLGSSTSFFRSLANRMDIRFLLTGSMLPDIIDKPVGLYIFRETFSNGRIFSHTLFFFVLVMVAGLMLRRNSGKTCGLALSIGTFFHLTLDQIWETPKTLFWPLFGIGFEKYKIGNWVMNILQGLLENPKLYVPEIIGFVVLGWFGWELLRRRAIIRFLRKGSVY